MYSAGKRLLGSVLSAAKGRLRPAFRGCLRVRLAQADGDKLLSTSTARPLVPRDHRVALVCEWAAVPAAILCAKKQHSENCA